MTQNNKQNVINMLNKIKNININNDILNDIPYLDKNPYDENLTDLQLIEKNSMNIKYVISQTEELCFKAIQLNSLSIEYIKNPSYELCHKAIFNNVYSFNLIIPIINKFEEKLIYNLCLLAYNKNSNVFNKIYFPYELAKIILSINGDLLHIMYYYWSRQYEELHKIAINTTPSAIRFLTQPSIDLIKLAVSKDGEILNIFHYKNSGLVPLCRNDEIIKLALNNNGLAIRFIDQPINNNIDKITQMNLYPKDNAIQMNSKIIEEYCKIAVKQNGMALNYIKNKTDEICKIAINNNLLAFKYAPKTSETYKYALQNGYDIKKVPQNFLCYELYLEAVKYNGLNLKHVPNNFKTKDLCIEAIKQNYKSIELTDLKIKYIELFKNIIPKSIIIPCPICDNICEYYTHYTCSENNIICLECSRLNNDCYYKCGKVNYDVLWKNELNILI